MIRLGWFLLLMFTGHLALANDEIELSICHENDSALDNWQRISLVQITGVLKNGRETLSLRVRRAVCNESTPDTVCAAIPSHMFCRQSAIRRMNLAASWYATRFVLEGHNSYESFRVAHERSPVTAFQYADGSHTDDEVLVWQSRLRNHLDVVLQGGNDQEATSQLRVMGVIQNRIMAFNLATLIGHESYHMNAERCLLQEPSRIEKEGIFQHVLNLQTSNKLFCASYPDGNEIKADRCAMRQIENLQGSPITGNSDANRLESFAQRAASDMIAFQALTGYRKFAQLPSGVYTIPDFDQYFNPVYRLSLLAGSVSSKPDQPALCGDASSLFVHGVQTSFQQCGGEGQVSDELLAELPPGFEASWNGAPWTESSFRCAIR